MRFQFISDATSQGRGGSTGTYSNAKVALAQSRRHKERGKVRRVDDIDEDSGLVGILGDTPVEVGARGRSDSQEVSGKRSVLIRPRVKS